MVEGKKMIFALFLFEECKRDTIYQRKEKKIKIRKIKGGYY